MASALGYAYEHRFWVDDDIIHRYSSLNIRDDIKFLFEIRTNFRVRDSEGEGDGVIIDRERFEIGAENCSYFLVFNLMEKRLIDDYWFTFDECCAFTREASAFAAAAAVEHTQQRVIPIAVEIDVCTVRQTGESTAEANDRAIRSEKLFPLFLMYNRNAFVNVEKSPYHDVIPFLREGVSARRVYEDVVEYLADCSICRRTLRVGDHMGVLELQCYHYFHYDCLLPALLTDHTCCPCCSHPISMENMYPFFDILSSKPNLKYYFI